MSKLKETKRLIRELPEIDRDAVNDLVKLLNSSVIAYCNHYVNPNMLCVLTINKSKSEYPVSTGSGFIYRYDDRLYFVTANHVINDIPNTYLLISTTQNINPILFNKLGISRDKPYIPLSSFIDIKNKIIDDKHDLYIAPLTDQNFRYVSNSTVVGDCFQSFVVTGFPASKNNSYVNESFLSNNDIKLMNANTDPSFVSFKDEGIFIDYEKNAISVRGCSGAPLAQLWWSINKNEKGSPYLEILSHNICGVLTEYRDQRIAYTNISVVHELLNKKEA